MNTDKTLLKAESQPSCLGAVMPSIGSSYSIVENGTRIFGYVESYQGDTGKFWVKWTDGEITLESKIDKAQ